MITIKNIADTIVPTKIIGNQNQIITDVIKFDIHNTKPDLIAWVSEKNSEKLYNTTNGIYICSDKVDELRLPQNCTFLLYPNPRSAFRELLINFFTVNRSFAFISPTAFIGNNVKIGNDVYIGHHTVIEDDVTIGNNVVIGNNNSILAKTIIHDHVQIGSNNTIGGVGFGYEKDDKNQYQVIPHIGNVVIEEYVEIGNNTCIDKAVLGSTLLKRNSKIDNLVHIAHGVIIGENSLIIAHAIIGGSTQIGNNCWIAPNSSIINGITIGNNVTVGLGAVVIRNVQDNEVVIGNPAKPIQKK